MGTFIIQVMGKFIQWTVTHSDKNNSCIRYQSVMFCLSNGVSLATFCGLFVNEIFQRYRPFLSNTLPPLFSSPPLERSYCSSDPQTVARATVREA